MNIFEYVLLKNECKIIYFKAPEDYIGLGLFNFAFIQNILRIQILIKELRKVIVSLKNVLRTSSENSIHYSIGWSCFERNTNMKLVQRSIEFPLFTVTFKIKFFT